MLRSKQFFIYFLCSIASMLVFLPVLADEFDDFDKQVDKLVDDDRPVPDQVVYWQTNSMISINRLTSW